MVMRPCPHQQLQYGASQVFFLYFGFGLQAPHPNPPSSPLPPSYHGDVPSPAAAVRCVLQDYFFSALDLVYRSHIPIPPPCHHDAPSPAAVWYVFSFFFVLFFSLGFDLQALP